MSEVKDYLTQPDENGCINIAEDVVASIAAISAAEVEGVASLSSNSVDIAELLGKKSISKGVKIQFVEDGISIDVYIMVKYGFIIPSIAKSVQENVTSAVESMAGLTVISVNVHVTGITFEKESKKLIETAKI